MGLALLAALFVGATAALLLTRPPDNGSPEAGFARDMIVHHAQAIQMAEIVRDKTQNANIRLLATDIALTQQAQIGMMQGWLEMWGLPIAETGPAMAWMGHPTEGLMPGMAKPDEIDLLSNAPPDDADKLFLILMINHHRAAIPMAQAILGRTDLAPVRQLAESIKSSQQAEIQTMQDMLSSQVGNALKVALKPQNGSHVTGTATLTNTEGGSGVRVKLDLSGLPKPNALYLSHIHPGSCAEGEPSEEAHHNGHPSDAMAGMEHAQEIEYALSGVQSDASGSGTSTTTLKHTSLVELLSGGGLMHVNVHAPGSGEPPVIACADLY
jgi:uncharacterized protein (DUF305 family)